MEGLDLPDWTQGLLIERSGIDCSPPKKPLAQVTLKDGNTQRVSALGRHGAAAFKPAYPVAAAVPLPAVPAAGHSDTENDASAAADAAAHPPHSAPRRTHTPSRTGLTAKAVRLPSRLGLTPGAKQPEQFVVAAGGQVEGKGAGAAPASAGVGNNLKSILKRLNFASHTKGRAAPAAPTDAPASSALHRQPAAVAAAVAAAPESTIKQLRFDAGTTPAAGTAAKPAGAGRHVSFDAATVSPAARSRPTLLANGSGAALPATAWRTPEPTIQEEDSASSGTGDEDDGSGPAGGSVNSARAGHTPYDRRLSSLFRKYQVAGTPELPEADLDDLVAGGAVSSPSWNRLSSASVPESIRELSKKYTSDMEGSGPEGLTPPHQGASMASPAGVSDVVDDAEAATPVQAGAAGRSPTLDPTPHNVLDSIMRRNALYESPPDTQEVAVGPAAVEHPASGEPSAVQATVSSGALSPRSAVAQLLGPMLRATLEEIDADKAAAASVVGEQQQRQEEALPAASPPSTVAVAMSPSSSAKFSSPAEFYGFPAMATPGGTSGGVAPSVHDSVPRDAEGIPIVTPATVTVRRGGYAGRREGILEEDDLAANLFSSTFSPSDSLGGAGGSPGFGREVLEFGGFAAGRSQQEQGAAGATAAGDTMTPAGADLSAEFSFFPAAAAAASCGPNTQQAAGVTPAMPVASTTGLGQGHPMDSNISPEILGFYEQQQAQQQDGMGSNHTDAGNPALPRSIIKSGKSLNQAGTPVLGRAQRVPAGTDAGEAPPTVTKELRALMADLKLEDASEMKEMGTVSTLSPVRTTGSLRGFLGGLARAITPVRRSARKRTPGKPLEAMLEETGYSYVPNAAMMPEDAQPKLEAAEAKQARKAASCAASQATSEPSLAGGVAATAEVGQPEVSNMAPAGAMEAEQEQAVQMAAAAAASSTPTAEPAASNRRMSLRRLRTPQQQATPATPGEAVTPKQAQAMPVADMPVEQDASPQLGESPGLAPGAGPAEAPRRSYSLRPSTLKKKARQSIATPKAAAAEGGARGQAVEGGAQEQGQGRGTPPPQLSPTEQGIRASLRRSARKSKAPK